MTRDAFYKALNDGKVLFSNATKIAYKQIKGELHKKCFYGGCTQREWLPSECVFKNKESTSSMIISKLEDL